MRFLHLGLIAALFANGFALVTKPREHQIPRSVSKAASTFATLQAKALANLKEAESSTSNSDAKCTLSNAAVRKDWSVLTSDEKKKYIAAVQCMLTSPSKSDPAFAPGARNRYDDFVAVHINKTLTIHVTGNFLTFHRLLVWAYEKALREECGYDGYQPYWNWFEFSGDLASSPLFDGSDTSMGGDGEFVAHNGAVLRDPSNNHELILPSGNGGGCVKSGPLASMTVNLGPVVPAMDGIVPNPSPDGPLGYNPRCLVRDLSNYAASTWFTEENLVNITTGSSAGDIASFQNEFQGRFLDDFLGLHATGHLAVGGESGDLYSAINDPTFLLQHAMADQVYWIWQALHPDQAATIAGTITIMNRPPSRDALVTDILDLGVNADPVTIQDVFDTLGATPLCYIYQ